ncbi:MAG TPA: cytochrome c5 family protein [Chromatiales bacterium]|nr:cytochrome c5 family protein [Chromatiales bacterium]
MLVLGILIGTTLLIFLTARYIASQTQEEWVREDSAYQSGVEERIKPFGSVALPGDTSSDNTVAESSKLPTAAPVAAKLTGPQVYNATCIACHGTGIGGAPKVGNANDWAPRIAQGKDVLADHALQGFTGSAGYMPPKGGRVDLSDEEILAAMNYMLDQSR